MIFWLERDLFHSGLRSAFLFFQFCYNKLMRKFLILPIAVSTLIAFINLFFGNIFYFWLWIFATMILSLALAPVIKRDANDKYVPIFHIFSILGVALLAFGVVFYFQFRQANVDILQSSLFAVGMSVGAVATIMLLKGSK